MLKLNCNENKQKKQLKQAQISLNQQEMRFFTHAKNFRQRHQTILKTFIY